ASVDLTAIDNLEPVDGSAVERVVLLPFVDANDGPHPVIVGRALEVRMEGSVQNEELRRAEEQHVAKRPCSFAPHDRTLDSLRVLHDTSHHVEHPLGTVGGSRELSTPGDEILEVEQGVSPSEDSVNGTWLWAECGAPVRPR